MVVPSISSSTFVSIPYSSRSRVSSTLDHFVVVKLYVNYAILRYSLHCHSLEVNRHSSLELIRAEIEDPDTLGQRNVGVVVLVEDRETVVPSRWLPSDPRTI